MMRTLPIILLVIAIIPGRLINSAVHFQGLKPNAAKISRVCSLLAKSGQPWDTTG